MRKNVSGVEKKGPEMTSVKSQLYITFGINGQSCTDAQEQVLMKVKHAQLSHFQGPRVKREAEQLSR